MALDLWYVKIEDEYNSFEETSFTTDTLETAIKVCQAAMEEIKAQNADKGYIVLDSEFNKWIDGLPNYYKRCEALDKEDIEVDWSTGIEVEGYGTYYFTILSYERLEQGEDIKAYVHKSMWE